MTNVFVYGMLKKDFLSHSYLKGSKFLFSFEWKTNRYKLVSLGFAPAVISNPREEYRSIFGEVYEITEEKSKIIDEFYGFPKFYDKIEINTTNNVKAWIYILQHGFLPLHDIENGVWEHKEMQF